MPQVGSTPSLGHVGVKGLRKREVFLLLKSDLAKVKFLHSRLSFNSYVNLSLKILMCFLSFYCRLCKQLLWPRSGLIMPSRSHDR